ncbi:MAG TPA: lytic murein transglycosylase [Anaerolineae bacterium]|nr:lytic murein transglycosylase [Anaerolineae bacterium]
MSIKITRCNCFIFICLMALQLFLPSQTPAGANKKADYFNALQKRLIEDGFNKNKINALYARHGVYFDTKGVSLFFSHSEGELNYDQFLSKGSIKNAKQYLKKHMAAFDGAGKTYSVDKEIITAIILVETRLGTCLGGRSILNTLSTMASLKDPHVKNMLWSKISDSSSFISFTRDEFDKKAEKKSTWAYSELKDFLKYSSREKIDPLSVSGSYAGAIGISQFMPSNILAHAKDGNRDGCVDLFNHTDAIVSIASYLQHYGWRAGIDDEKAYKILLSYNYSKYYANIILKIAKLLKG